MAESKIMAVTGNTSAAIGAALCAPDVIAAYPITPQSSVVEYLAGLVAEGDINSRMVQVESEHSAMSVVQGAVAGGVRAFTATSAQGLALMYEPYFRMSTLRLPMVMAVANREMTSPETIWCGQQDTMSLREAGWMQVYCESNQEILDMIIQGYRLSEDVDVQIPINVCYDGFYLSHLTERLVVPAKSDVDKFLPKYAPLTPLDPKAPMALDPLTPGNILIQYRKNHLEALQSAIDKIDEIDEEFYEAFGRKWCGCVDKYLLDDAETVLITIGSITGTAREAVDRARAKGIKVGLLKIRFMRPFPEKHVQEALAGKKAWAAIDRSVHFGTNCGPVYNESLAAAGQDTPSFSAIGGLGGADVSDFDVMDIIEKLEGIKGKTGRQETVWIEKQI